MSDERLAALERIFGEARQLAPSDRAEFIAHACGTNDSLRAEVSSLLAAETASGEFMNQPAFDRLAQAVAREGWSVRSGDSIGPYTIVQLLGSGGAGEVWRARDERLGRDVAIKVLLPHFATDSDRLRRFADEARTVGALNHSNILTVYDVGEHQGIPYLVSECLEGQSLRRRMETGPIPVTETVALASGICRGLSAAHARSIVHRDLKPENTFVRSDGVVKILDFGLAKLQQFLEGNPTVAPDYTLTGVIVGTAGYMAPEQIIGDGVDARADLFALGVMLYEMLTEQHPFRRASTFETLHAVLTADPPDVALTTYVPPTLARIVMRLLQKTPDTRFQTALDVLWALEQVENLSPTPTASPPPTPSRPSWLSPRVLWAMVIVSGALALSAAWAYFSGASPEPAAPQLTRFSWPLPQGTGLGSAPVVSPDGRYLAFVGIGGEGTSGGRLYVRDRGSPDIVMIPGTDNAQHPFWSPDSASLAFFARGRLMKVAWPGGAPVPIAENALFPFGGAWGHSGTIVFAPDVIMAGLRRVDANGGAAPDTTVLDLSLGDTSHCWPVFLPDGVHFVYFVRSAQDERRGLYIGRIDRPAAPATTPLLRSDSNALYVPIPGQSEGVLLSVVEDRVEARRFNPNTLTLAGEARTIAGVSAAATGLTQPVMVGASADVLVFATSTVPYGNRLEAVDRNGQRLRLWNEAEAQNWPRLSADGQRLARQRVDPLRNTPDVWVEDLVRGSKLRVTTAIEPDIRPVWSPDGRYLAYVSGNIPLRTGRRVLSIAASDGTGVIRTSPCPGDYCEPTDWTARGLLVNVLSGQRRDVWIVPTKEGTTAEPLLADTFSERDARMSRDGRWVAYVSDESGRPEVSVRTVSGPPQRVVVSSAGGDHPVWRQDNHELFFIDPEGQLSSVAVRWSRDGIPAFGLPQPLNVPPIGRGHWGTPYDVSADGSRIYFLRRNDDPLPREVHVVIGWRALLD